MILFEDDDRDEIKQLLFLLAQEENKGIRTDLGAVIYVFLQVNWWYNGRKISKNVSL